MMAEVVIEVRVVEVDVVVEEVEVAAVVAI